MFKSVTSAERDKGDLEDGPIRLLPSRDGASSTKAPPGWANTYGNLPIHGP